MNVATPAIRLEPGDAAFPRRVTALFSGTLWAIGNTQLLDYRAIGICGSRGASASGLERSYEFGREVAGMKAVVVSGYARGVDRQAHKGALEGGGATIAVLPEGILHFKVPKELQPLVDLETNFLAVSMFEPDDRWQTWRAMQRNKLIVGLSMGLFVVEARGKGGTIDAAEESRRQRKPVYVVDFLNDLPGREGNRELMRQFAMPIRTVRELRRALEAVLTQQHETPARQLSLTIGEGSNGCE